MKGKVIILFSVISIHSYAKRDNMNVVFIMADDLGWNDPSYMGSDYYETPNIDKLASEGMIFTNAYSSAANSAPSRACFMSGMYVPRHGIFTVSPSERGNREKRKLIPIQNIEDLNPDIQTLGELFKRNGYTCGHIGKWHLGDDKDKSGPLSNGFDLNIAGGRAGTPYSYFYPFCNKKGQYHIGLESGVKGEYLTNRLTDEALNFIKHSVANDSTFFLYLSHHAVHTPLSAPKELIDKYKRKIKGHYHSNSVYAAMIESLDNSVGRVCDMIDSLGIADRTIIVFNSDNGGSEPITDNFKLRGGKGTPYEGGIRVPLIIKWPKLTKSGSKSDSPVSNIDFFPTFQSYLEGKSSEYLDGMDISHLLESADICENRDIFWHFPAYLESYENSGNGFRAKPYTSIRSDKWKLIYFYENKEVELYNLENDMAEEKNLAVSEKKVVKRLKKKLFEWIKATKAPIPTKINPYYKGE